MEDDPLLLRAREEAQTLRGAGRDWLRKQQEPVRADRETVLAVVRRDGLALEHACSSVSSDREVVLVAVKTGAFALQYAAPTLRCDRDFVLAAVQRNGYALACVSPEFQDDREVVLTAVREDGSALEYASDRLRADREIAVVAARCSDTACEYVDEKLWEDCNFVQAVAAKNAASALAHASEAIQDDRQFMLALVVQDPRVLPLLAEAFSADADFLLEALRQNPNVLEHIRSEFKTDHGFLLAAAKANPAVIQCMPKELWSDRDFVVAAALQDPDTFGCAASGLRASRDVVMAIAPQRPEVLKQVVLPLLEDADLMLDVVASTGGAALAVVPEAFRVQPGFAIVAIRRCGGAAQHVAAELWRDRDFVLQAIEVDWRHLGLAAWELRADRDFILRAVRRKGRAFEQAAERLRADREVLEAALEEDVDALGAASYDLRADRAVVLAAVRRRGFALEHAAPVLQCDEEVVLAAVERDGEAMRFAAPRLLADPDFVARAAQVDGSSLGHAAKTLRGDRQFVLQLAERSGHIVQYAAEELLEDTEFLLAAVTRNAFALAFVPAPLRTRHGFLLAAVRANPGAIRYVPSALQRDPGFLRATRAYDQPSQTIPEEEPGGDLWVPLEQFFDFCDPTSCLGGEVEDSSGSGDAPRAEVDPIGSPKASPRGAGELFDFDDLDEATAATGGSATSPAHATSGLSFGQPSRPLASLEGSSLPILRAEYRRIGLPVEPGIDREELLDRLELFRRWASLPSLGLVKECRQRGVPFAGAAEAGDGDGGDQAVRYELFRRLLTRLCIDAWGSALGIAVDRFAKVASAAAVVEHFARLAAMPVELLEAEHQKLGLPPRGTAPTRRELEEPLRSVVIWRALPLQELRCECERFGLATEHLANKGEQECCQELEGLLAASSYHKRGIPVQQLGSTVAAAKIAESWDRLEKLSGTNLVDDLRQLGLPADAGLETFGRGGLIARLKTVAVWRELPMAELQKECMQRHIAFWKKPSAGPSSDGVRQALIEHLALELFSDIYTSRQIPVQQVGSIRGCQVVLARWDCLEQLNFEGLALEFKILCGAMPEDTLSPAELLRCLKDYAVWTQMPLDGLRSICAVPRRQLLHEEEERQELVDHLLQQLCIRAYEVQGINVRQFASVMAATKVLEQWERRDGMSAAELEDEYRKLGLPNAPTALEASELRRRLKLLSYWSSLPFQALQAECRSVGEEHFTAIPNDRNKLIKRLINACWVQGKPPPRPPPSAPPATSPQPKQPWPKQMASSQRAGAPAASAASAEAAETAAARAGGAARAQSAAGTARAEPTAGGTADAPRRASTSGTTAAGSRSSTAGAPKPGAAPHEPKAKSSIPLPKPRLLQRPLPRRAAPAYAAPPRQVPALPAPIARHLVTLGLPLGAGIDDVKRAYKRLALKHHPDKNLEEESQAAMEQFCRVSDAYEALIEHFSRAGR